MKFSLASQFAPSSEKDWRNAAQAALKGKPVSGLVSTTLDGIDIEPLYQGCTNAATIRRKPRKSEDLVWDIVQRCDVPDIGLANQQALEDLEGGANGLSIVLPGAITAGRHGVPISSAKDLQRLLHDVELDLITVRLDGGKLGRVVAPMLIDLYRERNLDLQRCSLNLGLDPAASFVQTGMIVRKDVLVKRMAAMMAHCNDNGHTGPVFVADARVYQEAGSSGAQDVGLIAAGLVGTLRLLSDAGYGPAAAAARVGIVIGSAQDQFAAMCKLRALRLVWQRICETLDIEPTAIRIDTETSRPMMARHDPHVNLLRTTSAAFATGVGGADSVTVLPYSIAYGLPDRFARRMARNTQTILQQESGIGRVGDPAAGSGHVEQLTHDLAAEGWKVFQAVEAHGGMFAALSSGFVQSAICDMAHKRRRLIAERKIKLTGISEFATLDEPLTKLWNVELPDDWQSELPALLPANPEDEITCDRILPLRLAEDFEKLRDAADLYAKSNGELPQCVFLANLGTAAQFTARATWVKNLLAAGGIVAHTGEPLDNPREIAAAFKASDCLQACICSSDAVYECKAGEVAKALKAAGANYVWLAANPDIGESRYRSAGIDGFMYEGIDAIGVLQSIHALSGIEKPGVAPEGQANA